MAQIRLSSQRLIDSRNTQYQDGCANESRADGSQAEQVQVRQGSVCESVGANRQASRIEASGSGYLDGQLLIAMPIMDDERFARSVIYLCAHSSEGAMGIIVNRAAGSIDFPELLEQLDIIGKDEQISLPDSAESLKILKGGPVETGRGFVLHSSDFFIKNATLPIDDGICLTATLDILKAIANGAGPKRAVLALGYAGWAPGQLENEIQHNGWLHCAADADLIFGRDVEDKYQRALDKIGIDIAMLSNDAGHA